MTRAQAIRVVGDYLGAYRGALSRPRLPDNIVAFYQARIRALTQEIAALQTAGPEGDRIARAWGKVVPVG